MQTAKSGMKFSSDSALHELSTFTAEKERITAFSGCQGMGQGL